MNPYQNKELFIFDLDDTLFLHYGNQKIYETELIPFLVNLKNEGKILAIVTYNTQPEKFLTRFPISLFDYIYKPTVMSLVDYRISNKIYENCSIWMVRNTVRICMCKSIIVKDILQKYDCSPEKTIFFDDHPLNVSKVKQLGVESILVDPLTGIPLF